MNATAYPPQRLFPTEAGAQQLGMSQEMLRYRIRQGQVRAVRLGRRLFIPASEIDRLAALPPHETGGVRVSDLQALVDAPRAHPQR